MAIRFNRLIQSGRMYTDNILRAESAVKSRSVSDKMVFMSHKTGDSKAEKIANYISEKHRVQVYMAEWDDNVHNVHGDSNELPDQIMTAIRESDAFLVNVIAEIAVSMWIGYEIGGAHAMEKLRAKIMYTEVSRLPSVVGALKPLRNRTELDIWIGTIIR